MQCEILLRQILEINPSVVCMRPHARILLKAMKAVQQYQLRIAHLYLRLGFLSGPLCKNKGNFRQPYLL